MKAVFCFFLGVSFVLAGCGQDPNAVYVDVQRTASNEVQIKVLQAPAGSADNWLFFYQGYTQAQDRFLQMDVSRRLGQGRLSEILGPKAVAADRRSIGVGLRRGVELKTAYLREKHPEAYALLEAYSRGVNRFLDEMPWRAADLLKNYRQITGDRNYSPARWEAKDSVAVTQNMAFYLSSSLQDKLMLGQISAAITGAADPTTSRLAGKLDLRPLYNNFILDADRSQNGWRRRVAQESLKKKKADISVAPALDPAHVIKLPEFGCLAMPYPFPECGRKASFGSNNWVVSPEFAGGNTSYVANDPHLRLTFPFNFYAGGYDSTPAGGTLKMAGYGLIGTPGVLIGHNEHIAWAFTNNPADVDDVYLELLNDDKTQVWARYEKGQAVYEPLELTEVTLKVRNLNGGLDDQKVACRFVKHHGPVFSDHVPEIQSVLDGFANSHPAKFNVVGSYRWVGHEVSSEFAAMLGVNRARNFGEFKSALADFKVGAQNMIFADRQGEIGYYSHGKFPVRNYVTAAQAPFAPVIPYMRYMMSGVMTSFREPAEWNGYRTEMPELSNPPSGRIVTANNDPFGHSERPQLADFKDYFGYSFSTGARAERITELLDLSRGKVTLETMQKIQTDHVDLLIAAYLKLVREYRKDLTLSAEAAKTVDRLTAWNSEMKANQHEPLLADAWLAALTDVYLTAVAPEVNAALREGIDRTSLLGRTIYHKIKDGLESKDESKHKVAVALLTQAFENSTKKVSAQGMQEVPWGRLNRLHFFNPIAEILPTPALSSFPIERDGSWESVDVAGEGYGPNFRLIMILEQGKPIRAVTSVPGGNFSFMQKAQVNAELALWQHGQYRDMVNVP